MIFLLTFLREFAGIMWLYARVLAWFFVVYFLAMTLMGWP